MRVCALLFALFCAACTPEPRQKNHLAASHSAYLLDSKQDQIWWHPWGPRPLNQAKTENRLIFLSIGYTSCFACEKMQRDVYSDEDVADKLNESFISLKVDREDRPDLDAHFLNMQSTITGFGAWPINLILTPELEPVFATTLTDKKTFLKIITTSAQTWKNDPSKILQGATRYKVQSSIQPNSQAYFEKDYSLINDFYARYTHRFDTVYGGKRTGNNISTKFPVNDEMRLLLRYYLRTKDKQALKMVNKTMSTIAKSALLDHLAGGFHRYSSTRDWNSPNFEKMLYDQASFLNAYIDIYRVKPNDLYRLTIEKTVKFLLNSAQYRLGGFYSSFSASLNGKEGSYYTWERGEVEKQLSQKELKTFKDFYAFTRPLRRQKNRHGIRRKTSFNKDKLEAVEKKLHQYRQKRGEITVDPKIITADNAYVISALSRLHRLWPSKDLYSMIQSNLDSLISQHISLTGELYRRSIRGHVKNPALLDDYAYLIDALIEFYQTGFEERYLHIALELQKEQNRLFLDREKGLYRFSQSPQPFLHNQFLFIDQTRPSGQGLSYWNLMRLSRYFLNINFETLANKIIDAYPDQLQTDPLSYASLLLALDFKLSQSQNFIISSDRKDCESFSREGFDSLRPYLLFSCNNSSSNIPLHSKKEKIENKPTFYICDARSCLPPTNDYQKALKSSH